MDKLTPFGFSYQQDRCHIKLRFHPRKWELLKIGPHLGTTRVTRNGYVLFETTLYTRSTEFAELTQKLQTNTAS